jgi:hypothetical protein
MAAEGTARDAFAQQYRCLRLGDVFSLQFCNGWSDPHDTFGYRATLERNNLLISPDPFAGAVVQLRVIARRIPARSYASDADLRATMAESVPEILEGTARGL